MHGKSAYQKKQEKNLAKCKPVPKAKAKTTTSKTTTSKTTTSKTTTSKTTAASFFKIEKKAADPSAKKKLFDKEPKTDEPKEQPSVEEMAEDDPASTVSVARRSKGKMKEPKKPLKSSQDDAGNKRSKGKMKEPKKPLKSLQDDAGNADDFVGDEQSDEEDSRLDGERRKRNGVVERKEIRVISKRKKPSKLSLTRQKLAERAEKLQKEKELEAAKIEGDNNDEDMDDDNDQDADSDGKEAKTRAMDTFVSKPTKNKRQDENNAPHHANKRKKLVEKTFMNDKGYLVTEMVTEWVDVTYDDMQKTKQQETKRQEKKTIHKKKVKSSAGKNQSTMMGFFSVKK